MKKKNIIIIISSLVFLILIAILLTSYAFISNRVNGNETSTKVLFKRNSIKAEFIGGEEVLNDDEFIAGTSFSKEFTLKNTGDEFINYNIVLSDINNTFNRKDDIVYELYLNNELISTDLFPDKDIVIKTKETINKNEEKNYKLIIKYLKSFENQSIDNGKIIKAKIDFQQTE